MAKAGYINRVANTWSTTYIDNMHNRVVYGFSRVSFICGIISGIVLAVVIAWSLNIDTWISRQGNDINKNIATSEIRPMKVLTSVTVHKVFLKSQRPLLLHHELQMTDNILHVTIMVERDEHLEHWKKVYLTIFGDQYVSFIVVSKGKYHSVMFIHIMNIYVTGLFIMSNVLIRRFVTLLD